MRARHGIPRADNAAGHSVPPGCPRNRRSAPRTSVSREAPSVQPPGCTGTRPADRNRGASPRLSRVPRRSSMRSAGASPAEVATRKPRGRRPASGSNPGVEAPRQRRLWAASEPVARTRKGGIPPLRNGVPPMRRTRGSRARAEGAKALEAAKHLEMAPPRLVSRGLGVGPTTRGRPCASPAPAAPRCRSAVSAVRSLGAGPYRWVLRADGHEHTVFTSDPRACARVVLASATGAELDPYPRDLASPSGLHRMDGRSRTLAIIALVGPWVIVGAAAAIWR